jgi:hypothetical protein
MLLIDIHTQRSYFLSAIVVSRHKVIHRWGDNMRVEKRIKGMIQGASLEA